MKNKAKKCVRLKGVNLKNQCLEGYKSVWPWCFSNALLISKSSQINKMFREVFEQVLGPKLMNCAHMKNR